MNPFFVLYNILYIYIYIYIYIVLNDILPILEFLIYVSNAINSCIIWSSLAWMIATIIFGTQAAATCHCY